MGTTRVKVVDLSSEKQEVKTSRKHAAKIKPNIDEKPQEELTTTNQASEETLKSQEPDSKSKKTIGEKFSQIHRNSANYKKALTMIDREKLYAAADAIKILEDSSFTKFDPTVEIHINVTDKNVRGQVNFPHPIGPKKQKRYLIFSEKFKSEDPNVIVATDETVTQIESSRLKPGRDFDAVIATASYMPKLVKIAKVLGPAGMMPNPKNGTITNDPQSIIGNSSDAFEFRTDPTAPIIHIKLGKLSSKKEAINENLQALILAIGPTKIKQATIKTTMSPGIKLDFSKLG